MLINQRGVVHELMQTHLRAKPFKLAPALDGPMVQAAIALSGVGLDLLNGEQPLAFADVSPEGKLQFCVVVTDRRVLGLYAGKPVHVPHSEMRHIEHKTSALLLNKLKVTLASGVSQDLGATDWMKTLAPFLLALLEHPPEQREPPPTPLATLADGDPTGALAARGALGVEDQRTTILLQYIHAAHEAGRMPTAAAQDLVARVALAHRSAMCGRGRYDGRLITPLSAQDLEMCLGAFANAAPTHTSNEPARLFVYPAPRKGGRTAKAAASSAVGLLATATLGVGWVSLPGKSVTHFTTMVADTGSFASYKLLGPRAQVPLHDLDRSLTARVDGSIRRFEFPMLLRRCALGWSVPAQDLLHTPRAPAFDVIEALIGPVNRDAFG